MCSEWVGGEAVFFLDEGKIYTVCGTLWRREKALVLLEGLGDKEFIAECFELVEDDMDLDYCVFDIENTVRNKGEKAVGSFAGSPYCDDNEIVYIGYRRPCGEYGWTTFPDATLFSDRLYVGHNLAHDFAMLRRHCGKDLSGWMGNIMIWDTMIVEYLLSGQTTIMPNLDSLSAKYYGTLKDDRVKDMWNSGLDTTEIPSELLLDYLKADVENTEIIFLAQREEVARRGLGKFVMSVMAARMATMEMEFNGMVFDKKLASERDRALQMQKEELETLVEEVFRNHFPEKYDYNINSPEQLSKLLFGGSVSYKVPKPVLDEEGNEVLYKTGDKKGQVKTKLQAVTEEVRGLGFQPRLKWQGSKKGVYSTNDDVLTYLLSTGASYKVEMDLLEAILKIREINKLQSTYYKGYSELVWPDGAIHHTINECITRTGRMSCSQPNLQNAPDEVRKCFVSRFKNGKIMSMDLSQIEVVVQAFLSQDKNMMKDIIEGVDFHCKRVAAQYRTDYKLVYRACHEAKDPSWLARRKKAKDFSFQRAYGAGAKAIAEDTGMSIKEVKDLIKAEEQMYPDVVKMQQQWIREVESSRVPTGTYDDEGNPIGEGTLLGINGREWKFRESKVPDFIAEKTGSKVGFKPTEIKNYPIQALAGEILRVLLAELYYDLMSKEFSRDHIKIINTVHDSIDLDVDEAFINQAMGLLETCLYRLQGKLHYWYDIDFNLPSRAEISLGDNWGEQELIRTVNTGEIK